MSSQNNDSTFVNSMATYGRIKATIGFATSIIISIVLIIFGIVTYISNKNKTIKASVISINNCTNTTCNVVVSYTDNGKTKTKNVTSSVDIHVGDTINIHANSEKTYITLTIFIGAAFMMCICGSIFYKIVMTNKYIAAESAMNVPIYV